MISFKLLGSRKNKIVSAFLFGVALLLIALVGPVGPVHAQSVQDFVIVDFSATYELSNQDPQGFLQITEVIKVDFNGQNRGILRAIPQEYKGSDLNMTIESISRDSATEPYITYDENSNTVIRIGDPVVYITGEHIYKISYTIENVISFYDGYDELYWDINGDQWLQSFSAVSVNLKTDATSQTGIVAECFTGVFGAASSDCAVNAKTNGLTAETTRPLQPAETLTIVQAYEKGYFTSPTFLETYGKYFWFLPLVILQLFAPIWAYRRWRRYGKDIPDRGVIAPYFGRPKNVSLMQASYVVDNKLAPQHISAAIIDLAIRGYIQIIEEKVGRSVTHTVKLMRLADSTLTEDERMLLDGLFIGSAVGDTVKLEDKKHKLYKITEKLARHLDTKSIQKGYYELSPKKAASKMIGPMAIAIVTGLAGVVLAEPSSGVTFITGLFSFVFVLLLMLLMTKRSIAGNMLVEHMKGLKLYLERAEKDRMKMQDAVAVPLSPHTGEPLRDVTFFEKLLPFAVATGVEKSWANAFKDIYAQPPEWFGGKWNTFSTVALASSLSNTTKVTSQSFTAPSSSGSSGSSGGGFSGGGGGGGGGGGW